MSKASIRFTVRLIPVAIRLASLGLVLAFFSTLARAQEPPTFEVWDFGVVPRPALQQVLLNLPAVQDELRITDAQQKERTAIIEQNRQKFMQARREAKDRAKLLATRDALDKEFNAALMANLTPEQRERLDQIQLQAQGPLAFASSQTQGYNFVGPPLSERLKLSEDQARRALAIYREGTEQIQKAASFPIALDSKNGPPTMESIRKLVESPEFRAARQKASQAGREATSGVIRRIEELLTAEQRESFHKLVGKPFDLSKLEESRPGQGALEEDVRTVAAALGVGGFGGQRRPQLQYQGG